MTNTMKQDVRFRTVDGLEIRYADTGGTRRRSILLTSPWPESLYCFARIWPTLAAHARLFAVDLPGFGGSEGRHDLLSPRAMGAFLARLIVEANLGTPQIVAPCVGTPAALFAAAQHPNRIGGLIVGGGGTEFVLQLGEPLTLRVLDADRENRLRREPRAIVDGVIDMAASNVSDTARDDYLACYSGDRLADSMRYMGSCLDELPALGDLLPQINMPVAIIKGGSDRVPPLIDAEYLHERLGNSHIVTIDAGHFSWEERPWDFAAIIADAILTGALSTRAARLKARGRSSLTCGSGRRLPLIEQAGISRGTNSVPSFARAVP